MKAVLGITVILLVLGSPVWISILIRVLPRRLLLLDVFLCLLQGIIVYGLWWFFWGGGIGGEARLSTAWQQLGLLAVLPLVTVVYKYLGRS